MLKKEELIKMTPKELDAELAQANKDLFHVGYEVQTGTSKANHKIRQFKKYRAQIHTIKKQMAMNDEKKFEGQKKVKEEVKTEAK